MPVLRADEVIAMDEEDIAKRVAQITGEAPEIHASCT